MKSREEAAAQFHQNKHVVLPAQSQLLPCLCLCICCLLAQEALNFSSSFVWLTQSGSEYPGERGSSLWTGNGRL